MPKKEYEFCGHEGIPWSPVAAGSGAAGQGMVEKILNLDHSTGVGSRLLKFPPGVETSEPSDDVLRLSVMPEQAEFQEWLSYGFDQLKAYSARAYLHWENKKVPFLIEVEQK